MVKAAQQHKEGKRKASVVQVQRKATGKLEEKWSLLADNDKRAEQWLTKHFYGERLKRVSAAVRKSTKSRSVALPAVVFSTADQRMSERCTALHCFKPISLIHLLPRPFLYLLPYGCMSVNVWTLVVPYNHLPPMAPKTKHQMEE